MSRHVFGFGPVGHLHAPRGRERMIEDRLISGLELRPDVVWVKRQQRVGAGARRLDVIALVDQSPGREYLLFELKGGSACQWAFDQAFLYAVSLRLAGLVSKDVPIRSIAAAPSLCPGVSPEYLPMVAFAYTSWLERAFPA